MCHHHRDCAKVPGGEDKERDIDFADEAGYFCRFCVGVESGRVDGVGGGMMPLGKGGRDRRGGNGVAGDGEDRDGMSVPGVAVLSGRKKKERRVERKGEYDVGEG